MNLDKELEEEINSFHLPRWKELPNVDLYLDQVVSFLESYLVNYIKNDNDEFGLIQSSVIYDLIDSKYLELDGVLEIINKASLDHVVDSSNQAKVSVYNLLVRDLVISNKSDDLVIIRVVEDGGQLHINIDYTNLLKSLGDDILECEVDYVYTNINDVEEFNIMNKENVGD